MTQSPLGILLMAYGTPKTPEEIEPYYTHIRHGRPPTPELLADLKRRYEAIGGLSPLNEITTAQATGLEKLLNEQAGRPVQVFLGMKHAHPFIDEAVAEMSAVGVEDAVALVLAPHYSTMSVGDYLRTAREAVQRHGGPKLWEIESWHLDPRFIDLLAQRVQAAISRLPQPKEDFVVIFSAHSLPVKILQQNDPYLEQLRQTATAVQEKIGLKEIQIAWQSAGRTADTWLGPDILDVLKSVKANGHQQVVICSAGFVSDHLEVLYDIDVACKNLCDNLGIAMVRTASLNADPMFLQTLASLVLEHAPGVPNS